MDAVADYYARAPEEDRLKHGAAMLSLLGVSAHLLVVARKPA